MEYKCAKCRLPNDFLQYVIFRGVPGTWCINCINGYTPSDEDVSLDGGYNFIDKDGKQITLAEHELKSK